MQLYIIRHGQSTNNASQEVNRVQDPSLTDLGKQQAEKVADYLANYSDPSPSQNGHKGFGITRLYCSPMLRTLQTAQPISAALDLQPEVWVEIHEHGGIFLEYGDERGIVGFPGLTRAEIMEQFGDYLLPDVVTDQGWWNPARGMESYVESQARAINVADMLFKQRASSERIALVTHGTFADNLIKALFEQLPSRRLYYYHYNTAITRVDFYENRTLGIVYMNRIDHLPRELISF
jgi:2,3-bisphosphoglycerate-dependent phosphoglycerate mutase